MDKAKIPTTRRDLLASPLVVTARGVVVNGHSRLAVAQQLGIDELLAIVVRHPDIRSMEAC
jgi:ParB-like chromosome segregation protein Spo0J